MTVMLYAGSQRSTTSDAGRTTRHSFSFGPHYDPTNLGFGPMVCHNDDAMDPGAGYGDHPHSGLEIVTWVLEGALVHTDSTGAQHVLEAGRAQVLSAGSGIRHSEIADPASGRCRFVQTWLTSEEPGGAPSYSIDQAPHETEGLVTVAGGSGLRIRTTGASLSVARLSTGQAITLPPAARHHVFAATGSLHVAGQELGPGDALRMVDEGRRTVTPSSDSTVLVWSFIT